MFTKSFVLVAAFITAVFAISPARAEETAVAEPKFGETGNRINVFVPENVKLTIEVVSANIRSGAEFSVAVREQTKSGSASSPLIGHNNYVDWVNSTPTGGKIAFQSSTPAVLWIDSVAKPGGYDGHRPWVPTAQILKAHDTSRRVAIIGVDGNFNGSFAGSTVIIRW